MTKKIITACTVFFAVFFSFSQARNINIDTSMLVELTSLNSRNVIFRQFCQDVEEAYKNIVIEKKQVQTFYRYKASETDDLLSLASRLSLPYETIATLNKISATDDKLAGKTLIIPVQPGIFVAEKPSSSYEILLKKEYEPLLEKSDYSYTIDSAQYYFLLNKRFSPTQRAFFVDTAMKLPLDKIILTSSFGYRVSPISNKWKFHSGIDLAAPQGTNVYACKRASVSATGFNSTYGNYIILLHTNGMTSVYAHLSKIEVKKGDTVSAGQIIGKTGTTGASTGPHLHFEIRLNGNPADPGRLMTID